jgi:hypothetical protein
MELVFAILTAFIVWNWFQTGEIWNVLGSLAFLAGAGLLLIAALSMTTHFAQEFFFTIAVGVLFWMVIEAASQMVRRLRQRLRKPSRTLAQASSLLPVKPSSARALTRYGSTSN